MSAPRSCELSFRTVVASSTLHRCTAPRRVSSATDSHAGPPCDACFGRQSLDLVRLAGAATDRSIRTLWGVRRFDLLQVHNLLDWEDPPAHTVRMKAEGRVRYVGVTTSEGRRHGEMEKIMRSQPIDFVQVTYNAGRSRGRGAHPGRSPKSAASRSFQPPSGRGRSFGQVERHSLSCLASALGASSWAQYLLSSSSPHPAITCPFRRPARSPTWSRTSAPQPERCGRRVASPHGSLCRVALMSEWWKYHISDFLLFSPRTYYG